MTCIVVGVGRGRNREEKKMEVEHSVFPKVELDGRKLKESTSSGDIDYTLEKYRADYILEEDEFFFVDCFSGRDFCPPFLKGAFSPVDINTLSSTEYGRIAYLCVCERGVFSFQRVTPSSFLKRKTLSLGGEAKINDQDNQILIKDNPDAVYFKEEDVLVFRDLKPLFSVFDGIVELYKEATKEQVQSFLEDGFVCLGENFPSNKISPTNRKRLASIYDKFENMNSDQKQDISQYIKKYRPCIDYNENEERFLINNNSDLKDILAGLGEKFYTTECGYERRLSNSNKPL